MNTPNDHPDLAPDATDPALDALLDRALQPEPWPDDAKRRTLDAVMRTQQDAEPVSDHSAQSVRDDARPVLARIGIAAAWGVAAVLALGTVLVVLPFNSTTAPPPEVAENPDPTADTELAELETELDAWAHAADNTSNEDAWLADQFELLETQVALTSSETLWAHDDGWSSIEVADLHRELDAMAYPTDLTF